MFACCSRQIHDSFGVTLDDSLLYKLLAIHSCSHMLIWVAVAYLTLAPKLQQITAVRILLSSSICPSLLLLIRGSFGGAPMDLFAVGYI